MIIYKTTNLVNGKIYIGYDTKNRPNYYGSGTHYKRAEKKYGKENFRKATIDFTDDFNELCLKETFWIDFYDARNPVIGYNIQPGGQGSHLFGESNGMFGRRHTEIAITKMKKNRRSLAGENNPMYGKHFSDESKKKIRSAFSGRTWIVENGKRLWKDAESR